MKLAERMKKHEDVSRIYLPTKTYTLFRADGKNFKNYTKGLKNPYDEEFMAAMDEAAIAIAKEASGCKVLYVQSDEISGVLTDFDNINTTAWFDNNLVKMATITASTATIAFYMEMLKNGISRPAKFDARFWTESSKKEVLNNFLWRQQDAIRNAKQKLGQTYIQGSLKNVNTQQIVEKCKELGYDFYTLNKGFTNGRLIYKTDYIHKETKRTKWISVPAPMFDSQDGLNILNELIPTLN